MVRKPHKRPEDRRTRSFPLRLTEREYEILKRLSDEEGLAMNPIIREAVFSSDRAKAIKEKMLEEDEISRD